MRRFMVACVLMAVGGGCSIKTTSGITSLPNEATNIQVLSNGWRTCDITARTDSVRTTSRYLYHESDPGRLTNIGVIDTHIDKDYSFLR